MQPDRSTKILFTLIALALWGMLLKPLVQPIPTRAEPAPAAGSTGAMMIYAGKVWVTNGFAVAVFEWDLANNRIRKLGQAAVVGQ